MPQDPIIIPFASAAESLKAASPTGDSLLQTGNLLHMVPADEALLPPRFFTAHLPARVTVPEPTPQINQTDSWVAVVLLLALALMAWINVFYRKRMKQFFSAFVSNRFVGQMVREEQAFTNRGALALDFVNLLITSLFVTQSLEIIEIEVGQLSGFVSFAVITGALLVLFVARLIAVSVSGVLFRAENVMTEYQFNLLLFNNLLAVALLPVVVCIAYFPIIAPKILVMLGAGVVAVAFIARVFKVMVLALGRQIFHSMYIILYICTLEILPFVVLIKVLFR